MGGGRRHDKGNKPVPVEKPYGFKVWKSQGPRDMLLRKRRSEAMQLRASGMPLEMIGANLHADPSMNTKGESYPLGYGWRKYQQGEKPLEGTYLSQAVSKDISRAMKGAELASETARQESLELALYKLDLASSAIWPRVLQGRERSLEVWLKLEERRAKLLGLDKAEKVEHSGEQIVRIIEGEQPSYDEGFAKAMFTAMQEMGVETPELTEGNADEVNVEAFVEAEVLEEVMIEDERTSQED